MVVYAFGLLPEMKEAHFFERHRLRRETEDRSSVSLLRRCLREDDMTSNRPGGRDNNQKFPSLTGPCLSSLESPQHQ